MSISHESNVPWDNASADIVLRSSNGLYFKADRLLLIRTFQAFEDMFSCAEIGVSGEQETKDGCIVIELSESSATVERLLRLIYCMNTRLDNLDSAAMLDLCVALDKYCVKSYPRAALERLTALAGKEPELVYIYACRLRLYEVARAAATASLRVPRLFSTVSLSELNISARQYHALVSYRADCLEKAVGIVKDFAWMGKLKPTPPGLYFDRSCDACHKTGPRAWLDPDPAPSLNLSPASRKVLLKPQPVYASSWLSRFLELIEGGLVKDTSGAVARDWQHIDAVFCMESSVICDGCRTAAHALAMVGFAEKLALEIDMGISTVPFNVPDVDWTVYA